MTLLQHCELESCYGKEIIIQYEKLSDRGTVTHSTGRLDHTLFYTHLTSVVIVDNFTDSSLSWDTDSLVEMCMESVTDTSRVLRTQPSTCDN